MNDDANTKAKKGNANLVALIVSGVLAALGALYFFTHNNPDTASVSPPASSVQNNISTKKYPVHHGITATVFWAGEDADASNDYIQNRSSAWMDDWVGAYGGIDSPDKRCGDVPCAFTPAENPFYFALPFSDYNDVGLKPAGELKVIPWYDGHVASGSSLLKNRWIKVTHDGKIAYAQWEDVGPFGENDSSYVFGSAMPKEKRAGLDLSPALANRLSVDGRAVVSWQFVDEQDVPDGPWKKVITHSDPKFNS